MSKKCALIMVTYNNYDVLLEAITSVYLHTNPSLYQLFIIDNASTDKTKELSKQSLINTHVEHMTSNLYWVGGINRGLELTQDYDYIFFLNDDIEVYNNWLENHIHVLDENKKIGAVGPLNSSPRDWQFYNNVRDKFNLYGILPYMRSEKLDDLKYVNNQIKNNRMLTIRGMLAFFCTAFRRETIDKVGYLDERFVMGGDDDAYCRELEKNNYKLVLLLNTYIKHKAGSSINKMETTTKKQIDEKNRKLLRELYPEYYLA